MRSQTQDKGLVVPESQLLQEIGQRECNTEEIADRVIKNQRLLPKIFEGLSSDKARIKYGCVKILRIISEKNPGTLYPKFDFFINLLDSDNTFLKWGAIDILANLASVDSENQFEGAFNKYFSAIPGPVLITAANVVGGAARIVLAKPELSERITKELLKVENAKYQTTECRNVALGHVIQSFYQFFYHIEDKELVIALIKRQLTNTRNATKKKAEKFMEKHKIKSF